LGIIRQIFLGEGAFAIIGKLVSSPEIPKDNDAR